MEQRDLPLGGALPVELFGVAPGCGAGRRCGQKFANCLGEAAWRGFIQNTPRLGCGDDIVDTRKIGDDDRRSASHALQQDVGPALPHRRKQEEIGRAINLRETTLRYVSEKTDTIAHTVLARSRFDCSAFMAI